MVKEQTAQSPSVVCIHMNVDNTSQPRGKEQSCKCHNFCSTHPASTPYLSGKRRKSKLRRKHKSHSSSRIDSRANSSESLSSDGAKGVLWQPDIENSKPKESSSNSTSTSISRDKRTATYRPGILREDQPYSPAIRPKSRSGHTGTRSHGRRSRSTSDSVSSLDGRGKAATLKESKLKRQSGRRSRSASDSASSLDGREKGTKLKESKLKRQSGRRSRSASDSASSLDSREKGTKLKESKLKRQSRDTRRIANNRKHHKRDHLFVKSAKHKTLSRNKSPTASSRSPSRSYSDSDVSSVNLESDFVPESRSKKSWREARHLSKNMQSESEDTNDGERKRQFVEHYSRNILCKPEVHSVELINTIGIVNEGCAQCPSGRGHTICMCQPCMNRMHKSPGCLVCSQCYAIPSSNTEHSQRMLTANCAEIPSTTYQKKPYTRDEHSHKKTHRQKSGRTKSPERRKEHGHSRQSHEKREVDGTCLCSCNCSNLSRQSHEKREVDGTCLCNCNCADCISQSHSQFYQCNLLLGQCCKPITTRQCIVFHRDNLCNQTHNRRESQCTLNESQLSDTPASQLSDTPASQLSDTPASQLSDTQVAQLSED